MTFLSLLSFHTWVSVWQNLSFIWPWMVAFLPLPWIVRLLWKPAEQTQIPLLAPHLLQRFNRANQSQGWLTPNTQSAGISWFLIFLWGLLILAAMRPIWYLTPTPFEESGKDMMLAVDLSGSMEKQDMRVEGHPADRLTAVKSVVKIFIGERQGDRLGLIVFGTQAFLQSPLTYDLKTVQILLNDSQIGMAGNNTAIGDAIGLTLKHLRQIHAKAGKDNAFKKTVLILLTDGSNTAGAVDPLDAAQKAQEMGLKIYTIGIGGQQRLTGIDAFLNLNSHDMDIASLQKIATMTKGQFFHAADTAQLDQVYQTINQLEATEHEVNHYRLRTELFQWPLGLALLLSFILAWRRTSRGGKA
jgi:Ca-activated chloride channel homolog